MVNMYRTELEVQTKPNSFVDLTQKINEIVRKGKIKNGLCNIFIPGTTAGLMMNEKDIMLMEDFKRFFSIIDEKRQYNHPDNAFSHLRANLLSTEKTIPVGEGNLILGTWQSILLWEFDIEPRKRKLIITVIEEAPAHND
jgi:secondary thiamine-phosphate synthase enzyme